MRRSSGCAGAPLWARPRLLTLVLLTLTITGWFTARRDHATISQLRARSPTATPSAPRAEAFLNQPENRTTRDQSQFINELIERKSFSWTRVLEDLEKVMPPRVHLVSIHPELDEENQLALKMVVAGDSRDRAIELAHRMEESRHFESDLHRDGELGHGNEWRQGEICDQWYLRSRDGGSVEPSSSTSP